MTTLSGHSKQMKACFLTQFGTPEEAFAWREIPVPVPSRGQVRIRVKAFGLNYADIMARQGLYRGCPPLPCVLGYDVEGTIDAVGDEVSKFSPGDYVFALTRFNGYAEYVVVDTNGVGFIPSSAPVGTGCALAVQGVTAYHAAIHVQTLMPGEKVVIHAAAGGLGTALIQICKKYNTRILAVAGGQGKMEYLNRLGVEHAIDRHQSDYRAWIRKHWNGRADVVFDNVGGSSIKKAKSILAFGGRIILLGAAALSGKKGKWNLIRLVIGFGWFSPISFLGKSQSLIGINMLTLADHHPETLAVAIEGVQQLYQEGVLIPHIGRVYDAHQLPEAHQYMEKQGAIGKVVITFSPQEK